MIQIPYSKIIGWITCLFGIIMMASSLGLLLQTTGHVVLNKGKPYFYANPPQTNNSDSNDNDETESVAPEKFAIITIIITTIGLIMGSIQFLTSIPFCYSIRPRWKRLFCIIWIGAHITIFLLSTLCSIVGQYMQVYEYKNSTVHNPIGHAYCSILLINSSLLLIVLIFMAIELRATTPGIIRSASRHSGHMTLSRSIH